MVEAYSLNVTVAADSSIPLNNIHVEKGCTARLVFPTTIELNKCGVYMVAADASSAATATIQLAVDGALQPQAQSTGTSPSFVTLVQVDHNNGSCCCSSPTFVQLRSITASTYTDVNVVVTKIC